METTTPLLHNKWSEFSGHDGESLLDDILSEILPLSLYRTWQKIVKLQSHGNDFSGSIKELADSSDRSERTIQLNIQEFEQRGLVEQRCEQKVFTYEDGSQYSKTVVVKDFGGLYDLAYEYLLWTKSPDYVEAKRDFAKHLQKNEQLKVKLLRFDNYRKIIMNKVPGPPPADKEIHRWYREYNPDLTTEV